MDRLRALETLVAIADTGSFRRAAVRLGLSPAMATTHINRLEERLGVKLIQRSTRRLALTEQGTVFVKEGRALLDGLAAAESRARAGRSSPAGRVRVDAPASFGSAAIVPALPRLREAYPDIVVELTLGDRGTSFRPDGFDILVRVGDPPVGHFVKLELGFTRLLLVASPDYLQRRGIPTDVASLAAHDCLLYSSVEEPGGHPWRFAGEDGLHWVRATPVVTFNEGRAMADAAMEGVGIAQALERQVRDALADGRLVELLPDCGPITVPVMLLAAPERHALPAVATLMHFLASEVDWGLH